MVCYRRRGHNEADDPSLTQPLMYNLIDVKRSVRKLYTEALIGRGDISVEEAEEALRHYQDAAREGVPGDPRRGRRRTTTTRSTSAPARSSGRASRTSSRRSRRRTSPPSITLEVVKRVVDSQLTLPEGFTVHPRLAPQLQRRAQMVEQDAIDWAMGETLAIGSLLTEGRAVRLAGQDSRRGTFGQRHAVIVDRVTGWQYKPLKRCYDNGGKLYVYDSLLSEFAAMGFEYGYSVARPDALVLWEAQFGDFANGAQTIIDEFIASGRAEVGPALVRGPAAPPRLRGPGPGPLLGPRRAVPPAVRAGQHDGRHAVDAGVVLPPAALAGPLRAAPAARRLHAEVHAAQQGGGVGHRGLHLGLLPRRASPTRRSTRRASAPSCSAAARSTGTWSRSGPTAARPTSPSSGWSGSIRCRSRRCRCAGGVPRERRGALGAGGAGQPGRLVGRCRSTCRRCSGRPLHPRHATRLVVAGGGQPPPARAAAGRARRRRVRPRGCMYFTDRGIEELEARRGDGGGQPRVGRGAAARVRRPEPGVRDAGRAAGHLARPPRRHRRRLSARGSGRRHRDHSPRRGNATTLRTR